MIRRALAFALAFALVFVGLLSLASPGSAQPYPNRSVTIIVPYPAGGPTDETARVVANFLSKKLGQNFIVENVTGAGTILATNRLVKAAPDGSRCCCTTCRLRRTSRC
jgi:tripartite-type tricarboxylate transporter receptor subunit TctC